MKFENCTCSPVRIGREIVGLNLNPDCLDHGFESVWYNSTEQVAKRREEKDRLRILQTKAKAARRLGVGCISGENFHANGECPVCDLAKENLAASVPVK